MNQYENIPEELKQLPQWVYHRNKIPFNPVTGKAAKAGQTNTWARFEDAVNASASYIPALTLMTVLALNSIITVLLG